MSATMTMTMATLPNMNYISSASAPPPHSCPKCGFSPSSSAPDFPLSPASMDSSDSDAEAALADAQQQIEDLQAQVRLLNQKATAAVDRWADYEDELARLRRQVGERHTPQSRGVTLIHSPSNPPSVASPTTTAPSTARSSFLTGAAASRLSALLSPRSARSTPNLKNPHPHPPTYIPPTPSTPGFPSTPSTPRRPGSPTPSADELLSALSREQSLRRAAEGKLSDTSREVEELSAQLFEQANEMVAEERRARARLEARVEVLERRDVEKRARLERLERAMARIERLRALLGESAMVVGGEEEGDGADGGGGGRGYGETAAVVGSGRSSPS